MNYPALLHARARYAHPRFKHEAIATELDQRNAEAYLQWRIRWAQHCTLPDAYSIETRALFNFWYSRRRKDAMQWINARLQPIRRLRSVS
jgi:hypothetical protein